MTVDNYQKYCAVEVVGDRTINPQNFVVRLTAKNRTIAVVDIQVRIYSWEDNTSDEPIMTISMHGVDLQAGESIEEHFFLSSTTLNNSYRTFRVAAVSGELT